MCRLPVPLWIANASACLSGQRGAVTQQAQLHGCSRQTVYDHAAKVQAAIAVEHSASPGRQHVLEQSAELRRENAQLWDWLDQTVEFPQAKQQEFAAKAAAMGLSLAQTTELLALILGAQAAPSRSTVHRWVNAAATAAGRVLERLDTQCQSLVSTACLDEIFFHGRPVLVGVEPQSMTLIMAQKEDRLDRAAWVKNLVGWDALDYVVSDAGTVLQSALSFLAAQRRAVGVALKVGLDVFHTTKEARRVLKILWNQVKKDWKAAEKADLQVARFKRRGQHAYRPAAAACAAWARVAKSMQRYDQARAAWQTAKEALELFRPDGRLNDRAWAQARVHEALPGLAGKQWTTLRHLLEAPEAFTFLDQLHARLAQLPIAADLSEALVRLWWLRQSRADDQSQKAKAILVQEIVCWKLDPQWPIWYSKVAGLLRTTVRASSVVESVNSVLRMHQSRHRTLNQGLLDLKRLYWNSRPFRRGRRRGQCPYQLLGVNSWSYDFWALVQAEIAQSTAEDGDKEKQQPRAA
jgi:hypothetical protein